MLNVKKIYIMMTNISVRQMRTLVEIQKHRKISAAAKTMGLTSPAVTHQLKQLEEELDIQLFVRTRTGAMPTEAGNVLMETAQRVLNELALMEQHIEKLKGSKGGRLSLGVVSTGKYFAPRMIAAFSKQFPEIDVHLRTANRKEIVEALEAYEIDMAFMGRPPQHFGVSVTYIGDHPLVFVAHPNNPLLKNLDISQSELANHKIIVREKGSGTRAAFEFFMSETFSDREVFHTVMQSNETIKQAVMANLGIALISGHTIEQEVKNNLLKILDVQKTPIRRQWHSVYRADRKPTPAMSSFNEFVKLNGMQLLPIVSKTYADDSWEGIV
jgi:molybdate transport repressor ModE-like protein